LKVDEVRLVMEGNVRQMISNQKDFTDLEGKSDNLKDTAFTMKNNAKKLEREARKRNCRLMAIIICIVVALLIQIIVPLAIKN
jgi:t-SNARE complex subunit (syntaxin)